MKDTLIAARALIADPDKWMKGDYAKDNDGRIVFGYEPEAICFCGLGAVQRAAKTYEPDDVRDHLANTAAKMFPDRGIERFPYFNDHPDTTHADVLAVFDKAIETC